MPFRLGIVGLCTSHPEKWVPLIRQVAPELHRDVVIRAVWDSGQVRPEHFARDFGRRHEIPHVVSELTDMLDLVDGVIIHSVDWDAHVAQAEPFLEAGKSVLIDKPLVGNVRDARRLIEWAAGGHRITGGSSLRFAPEVQEYRTRLADESGGAHTVFAGCGTDDFGYGIHGYSLLCGLMGAGVQAVRHLGMSRQQLVKVQWSDGRCGLLAVGGPHKLPFHATAVASGAVTHMRINPSRLYQSLLEACLPYLTGVTTEPPVPMSVLLEAELAALAMLKSRHTGGPEMTLADLGDDDPGYDGAAYAAGYGPKG